MLKVHADSIQQRIVLMHYLDQKALLSQIKTKKDIAEIDKDFKAYYADSILAANPTSIDISTYLGFKPGKQPRSVKKFREVVWEANAFKVLRLTEQYGYLSWERKKFLIEGRTVSPLQFTLRTGKYHKDIAKIFEAEYKLGNMPEKDYLLFTTMTKKDGVVKDQGIKKLEDAGIKFRDKKVNIDSN